MPPESAAPERAQRPTDVSPGRRLRWRFELAATIATEAVLGLAPLPLVARIGRLAGAIAARVLPGRRRVVERNLRIAFAGELSAAALRARAEEVFRRTGANLLCALRTARMSQADLSSAVTLRDEAVYREALARGRGVVMVLAHMGNWEALAQWFPRLLPPGTPGATVYRPLNNPLTDERLKAARARLGVGLFSKHDNPLGMAGFLRRGGVLGVLSDQRAGRIGEIVPFFGRAVSASPLPAILARRTGAALIGLSLRTVGPGRWELRFHRAPVGEPATAGVMTLVESMMRAAPEDVFWLQDRWRQAHARPHLLEGKPPRGDSPMAVKRRRALLLRGPAGAPVTPPPAEPDDVDYEFDEPRPGESPAAFIARVDAARPLPLDYVVGPAPDPALARAARHLGAGYVVGGRA